LRAVFGDLKHFVRLANSGVDLALENQLQSFIRFADTGWDQADIFSRRQANLGEDPAQQVTVQGVGGPVTDSVEMVVGRLGLPELGGSYFTFSNENNYLIWQFLAECNKRGWL
jgi:hypothetical protein